MYSYPARHESDDNGTIRVWFPDVPEAHTFGSTLEEAMERASEALEAGLSFYIDSRQGIPVPGKVRGRNVRLVALPALSECKVALYCAMREANVRKAELARRLRVSKAQVDRLLDLNHGSRMEQIEAAFAVLHKRLVVQVQDAT